MKTQIRLICYYCMLCNQWSNSRELSNRKLDSSYVY